MSRLNPSRLAIPWLAALAASALLSACIVVPARGGYGAADVVMAGPPPLQAEVVTVAPGPGYFWIGGYWGWAGGRHVWTGGHWEAQRRGYQWAPHQWRRDGPGWRAEPGRWERR